MATIAPEAAITRRDGPFGSALPVVTTEKSVLPADQRQVADLFHLVMEEEGGQRNQRDFETAHQAFLYAEKHPHLRFAKLWEGKRPVCALQRTVCASGSFWQVLPPAAHEPASVASRRRLGRDTGPKQPS